MRIRIKAFHLLFIANLFIILFSVLIIFNYLKNQMLITVNNGLSHFFIYFIGTIFCALISIAASVFIRNTYNEVVTLRENVERTSRAKVEFYANLSHEMRTPLNAIINYSESLLSYNEYRSSDIDFVEYIERINSASVTLLNIVNDVLDISKIESGKIDLYPEEYKLASLINDTVMMNIMRIGEKPVKFVLEIDDSLPAVLSGDSLRIKQICNNLLSNAFKYTEEGSVTWKIECRRKPESDIVWMKLTVNDTGIGIQKDDINELFKEYSQVGGGKSRSIEGSGLGLKLTKKMVEMMNGYINVESEYGKGSVFVAVVMQRYVNDEVIGSEVADNLRKFTYKGIKRTVASSIHRVKMPYAKILIVDDLLVNIKVMTGLLKPYEIHIDSVENGADAVYAIEKASVLYSAIFIDHMMPVMDGLETAWTIRNKIKSEYAKKVPIILMVAGSPTFANNLSVLSINDVIVKPIDTVDLNNVLMRWVKKDEYEADVEKTECKHIRKQDTDEELLKKESVKDDISEASIYTQNDMIVAKEYNVLVVDDILTNINVIIGMLKLFNLGIDYTLNGKEAIAKLKEREYNLIIMDHMMPGLNGIETLNEIRALDNEYAKKVPVIISSAYSLPGMEVKFLEHGFQDVLNKPISRKKLEMILSKYLKNVKKNTDIASKTFYNENENLKTIKIDESTDFDINHAINIFNGDSYLYYRILDTFISEVNGWLKDIEDIEDTSRYINTLFNIKGACDGICADGVSKMSKIMIDAIINKDTEYITNNNINFKKKLSGLEEQIRNYLSDIK